MRLLSYAALVSTGFIFTSCLAALAIHNVSAPDAGMASFSMVPGATIKVVSADYNQSMQSFVEQALAQCGLSVVAPGTVAGPVTALSPPYGSRDSVSYAFRGTPVVRHLYDEPDSDLILRYTSAGEGVALNSFSASVLDPATGRVLTSFARSYALPRAPERVMQEFVEALIAAAE